MLVGTILTAMAIPALTNGMNGMRVNSTTSAIAAAISQAHNRAIMNSQMYTLVLTTPGNTYVVTNVTANPNVADAAVPLPNPGVAINAGASGTYTFTLCPNGTVYGAGGACPGANPPALAVTYQGRETDMSISSTGNVTTTIIH